MQFNNYKLKNGLDVILINLKDSNSIFCNILIKSGSRADEKGFEGTAHMLEHMLNKGNEKYNDYQKLNTAIEINGGDLDMGTSFDYISISLKFPNDKLKFAIETLFEIVTSPKLPKNELEKEKGIVAEEIKMYLDDPESFLLKHLFLNNQFKDTDLFLPPSGDLDTVKNITIDSLRNYHEDYYVSSNMILTISGKFNLDKIDNIINSTFQKLERKEKKIEQHYKYQEINKYTDFNKKLEQSHILIGGLSYDYNNDKKYCLSIANLILGSGFNSKLYKYLREKKGYSYYQGCGDMTLKNVGIYYVVAGVKKEFQKESLEIIDNCIQMIINGDFSDDDIARNKIRIISSFKKDMETCVDYANYYTRQKLYHDKLLHFTDEIEIYKSINKFDIIKTFKEVYRSANKLTCVLN